MYIPYLRGKQYELIALRELLEKGVLSKKVLPLIEPVKLSSALVKTLEIYRKNERELAFITNPKVGSYEDDIADKKNEKLRNALFEQFKDNEYILFMNLLQKDGTPEKFIDAYAENMGTICIDKDAVPIYEKYFVGKEVRYNLIPDETGFRRKIRMNRVMLADRFRKLERNSDYIKLDDEPFSEDHLYYPDDGYKGFSDYSVVGREYSETGFAPYAVAIHIVYFDTDKSLRVKHFVSKTNDDISNLAGKFNEALTELIAWNEEKGLDTVAMKEFRELHQREAYPGLGTIKKLSIMHHLELMSQYLDKE